MVEPSLSEFTYGFGLSRELYNTLQQHGITAPIFPSLQLELALPSDLSFSIRGVPVFLQFKLSEALTTGRARYWSHYRQLYYQFRLYPFRRSPQHNRLVSLSKSFPLVFYCAPLFHTYMEFSNYFGAGTIWLNTKWIYLDGLKTIRGYAKHSITYSRSDPPWQHSDRHMGKSINSEELLQRVVRSVKEEPVEVTKAYLVRFWSLLNRIVLEDLDPLERMSDRTIFKPESPRDLVRAIQLMLRTEFGAEWFLFAESV